MSIAVKSLPGSGSASTDLPVKCCKYLSAEMRFCNAPATYWYQHGDDVCSFCERHNYKCGEPIVPLEKPA